VTVGIPIGGATLDYFPHVDGIFNVPLNDFDDMSLIRKNLRCSVQGGTCAGQ
jgi:hypothetical protein